MSKRAWRWYFETLCGDEVSGLDATPTERAALASMCQRGVLFWRCTFTQPA